VSTVGGCCALVQVVVSMRLFMLLQEQDVTVVDISNAMLEKDRMMAERHDFRIRRLQRCMTDLDG
jgi:hypothetical protein